MQQETYLTKNDYRVLVSTEEDLKPTAEDLSAAVVKVTWEPVELPLDDEAEYEDDADEEDDLVEEEVPDDVELFGRLHLTFNVNKATLYDLGKVREADFLTVVLELQPWVRHTFQGVVEPVQPAFSLERNSQDIMTCTIVLRVYGVAFWENAE